MFSCLITTSWWTWLWQDLKTARLIYFQAKLLWTGKDKQQSSTSWSMQSHVTPTLITGNKCFPEKHDQFDICLCLWSDLWLFILTVFMLSCPPTVCLPVENSGWDVVYMYAVHSQSLCVKTTRVTLKCHSHMRCSTYNNCLFGTFLQFVPLHFCLPWF